jgi:hypothetical protein
LYICVGGKGNLTASKGVGSNTSCGGYNGGGNAQVATYSWGGAGGGGATHIATNNRGTLVNYASNKTEIIMVAGGGGGSDHGLKAGDGGGISGTDGATEKGGRGGTQNSGGAGGVSGIFGKGADVPVPPSGTQNPDSGGAGGGGWYGGGSTYDLVGGCGGGGSGYVNTSQLTNTSMQSGVRSGNGYALITWMPVL